MDEKSHFLRNAVLLVGGVIVAGWLVIHLLGFLFSMMIYIAVGALAIGGGYYLYAKGRNALRQGRVPRRLGR